MARSRHRLTKMITLGGFTKAARLEKLVRQILDGTSGFWLDASDGATVFSDDAGTTLASLGGAVGCIKDKLGRGINFTQATAGNRPTWSNDADGFPTLLFDGVNDRMGTGVFSALNDPHTIIAGVRLLSARTHYILDNVTSSSPRVFSFLSSGHVPIVSDNAVTMTASAGGTLNVPFTFNGIRNGASPNSSIQKGDDARTTFAQSTTDDPTEFVMGMRWDAAGFANLRLTGLIFASKLMTQAEIDICKAYIKSKGGGFIA